MPNAGLIIGTEAYRDGGDAMLQDLPGCRRADVPTEVALTRRTAGLGEPSAKQTEEASAGRSRPQTTDSHAPARTPPTATRYPKIHWTLIGALIGVGVGLGAAVGVYAHHVILGVLAISVILTLCTQVVKVWTERKEQDVDHP
jgi:hypothetical protein